MTRTPRTLLSAVALGALLASCGEGESGPAETVPTGALVVTAVSGLRFDAATYGPVPAGEVTFGYVNEDAIRHTLIVAEGDSKVPNFKLVVNRRGDVDSGAVNLDAGTYTLICDVPGHSNMKATLTVE
ncbi:MAG: cupredoxin domain-containing protein [Ilumatobacteraceae bacterium]